MLTLQNAFDLLICDMTSEETDIQEILMLMLYDRSK